MDDRRPDRRLTHLDDEGRAHMVDVGHKDDTERVAIAAGSVHMQPATLRAIVEQGLPKGDVLTTAQLAGIMGAKQTPNLIPLCHPLLLTQVDLDLRVDQERSCVEIRATVRALGKTGVEMEALTAVCVAALTVYDMAKAMEKTMRIENVRLVHKRGGASGDVTLA
ncbi:MAG: cyclic pyranopterin monophosphate synthase MoaC [Anaerolineae bacterium]|nr:cyclic pyranopterin monophosphate synthase MoaC [Anaerolineae bacterium]